MRAWENAQKSYDLNVVKNPMSFWPVTPKNDGSSSVLPLGSLSTLRTPPTDQFVTSQDLTCSGCA
jgi:hypothetical protein